MKAYENAEEVLGEVTEKSKKALGDAAVEAGKAGDAALQASAEAGKKALEEGEKVVGGFAGRRWSSTTTKMSSSFQGHRNEDVRNVVCAVWEDMDSQNPITIRMPYLFPRAGLYSHDTTRRFAGVSVVPPFLEMLQQVLVWSQQVLVWSHHSWKC